MSVDICRPLMARAVPPGQDVVVMPQNDVTFRELTGSGMIRRKSYAAAGGDSDNQFYSRTGLIPQLHFEGKIVKITAVWLPVRFAGGGATRFINRRTVIPDVVSS